MVPFEWRLSAARATLKKKGKKKGKKKRSEGCRKNRPACSCAQQHVPRILEKLDIPQSSASRMSSREIYKGLRASLPRCLSHHVILYGGVLFPTKGGVAWWALKHRSQSLSQDATWIRRDSFSFSLCVHIYMYISLRLVLSLSTSSPPCYPCCATQRRARATGVYCTCKILPSTGGRSFTSPREKQRAAFLRVCL